MSDDKKPDGRAAGGIARSKKLSPEERSRIAREAAKARWEQKKQSISGKPEVLEGYSNNLSIAGIKLPCAVIKGPKGIQRVLSESGITNAILGVRSGASKRLKKQAEQAGGHLPIFLAPRQLHAFISKDLLDGALSPIEYSDNGRMVIGYDAEILPEVCNIWLEAREAGALQKQQLNKAAKAEVLTRALAKVGIVALVDEATGYEKIRPQNALEVYLEKVLRIELAAWAKKFPDEFYENIYALKGWPWPGMRKNRYSVVAKYTNNLVYERLGHGVLDELRARTPANEKGRRSHKFHQWLSDEFGNPMLAQHLHSIMTLQRLAISNGDSWQKFLLTVDMVLPKKDTTLELPLGDPLN